MSSGIRITGMNSGLDTESIIEALVDAKSQKVTAQELEQKALSWKQDAWKDLNTKVNSFFNGTLSKMKYSDAYLQKKTVASNESIASVVTGEDAVKGTQKLYVDQLAQTAFLTGAEMAQTYTGSTMLSEMEDSVGTLATGTISLTKDGVTEEIILDAEATIDDFLTALEAKGLNANFDENNQRFFISSQEMGAANDFSITETEPGTGNMLQVLGLDIASDDSTKIDAKDAIIQLNGVEFTSKSNTFEINGLTIIAEAVSEEEVSLTTADDTDGIFDLIKEFIEGYNELIIEMDTLKNADSASDYDMLSDDQRDEMSESEIEEWDSKIKAALLRNDDTLQSFASVMKDVMLNPIEVDGEDIYLSDFGINTLSYFEAEDNEKYALHIDGDEDDEITSGKTNALMSMISTDPEKLTEFFTAFTRSLYTSMNDAMSRTSLSSTFTVYNDIKMKEDYADYTALITEYEEELTDYEDRYYEKFSAMEVALAEMESNSSAISSLLGS